jgi:hypothetical protein
LKKLLIVLAILLLCGVGYFTYDKWVKDADLSAWSFVPSGAAIVFEAEILEDYRRLQEYQVWKTLEGSSGFSSINEGLTFMDSINGDGGFSAIFKNLPSLISLHKISNTDFDFLFVLDIQNLSQNTFISATVGRLKAQGYRFKIRNYNGFKISEIGKDGDVFTYIFYKNYFLASFTPYLVEDAIRTISDGDAPAFKTAFGELKPVGLDGLATMYVNYNQTGNILKAITGDNATFPLHSGVYSIELDSSYFGASGFSYVKEGWLSTHTEQASTFEMAEIIPSNTAYLHHITSSNFSKWKEKQMEFIRKKDKKASSHQDSLKKAFDFSADQVLDLVDDEIGLATLESVRASEKRKLFILKVRDISDALTFFGQVTERIAYSRGDSVYTESYSDSEIRFLPIQNFPMTILGEMADGFPQCFYMSYRNYLIFSNDLNELKNLVAAIQDEDTWGKSLNVNRFLDRTNNAANISLFVNIPRAWPNILPEINADWQDHFRSNSEVYKSIDFAAFQYSFLDGKYFTNFTFTQPEKRSKNIPKTNADNGVRFASRIITKPHLVRTHSYLNFDMIIQDSINTVYYLDKDQNALWTEVLNESIISEIFPIDYYKNGKLQYAFATKKQIHIIDKTGAYLPGFPKELPKNAIISHLNVIDYDLSRDYRFGITDIEGNIYLADKNIKILDGWNPRSFERKALQPVQHARLGRKDVMISIQENGVINLLNRRGDNMPGFPFDMKKSVDKNYFLKSSNSLSNSSISVVSTSGELVEISLEGNTIRRDQLIKTTSDAAFQLIPDRGNDSFIIVRKEANSYEVLDDTGNLLFKKNYLSTKPILIQYYQFGGGKDLILFTDTANKSLYIYDKSGNLITGNPLSSSHEVSLLYSSAKKELQVFTTWDANLELYSFSY